MNFPKEVVLRSEEWCRRMVLWDCVRRPLAVLLELYRETVTGYHAFILQQVIGLAPEFRGRAFLQFRHVIWNTLGNIAGGPDTERSVREIEGHMDRLMKFPHGCYSRDGYRVDEGTRSRRRWICYSSDLQNKGVQFDGGLLYNPASDDLPGKSLIYRPIAARIEVPKSEKGVASGEGRGLTGRRIDPTPPQEQSLQSPQ